MKPFVMAFFELVAVAALVIGFIFKKQIINWEEEISKAFKTFFAYAKDNCLSNKQIVKVLLLCLFTKKSAEEIRSKAGIRISKKNTKPVRTDSGIFSEIITKGKGFKIPCVLSNFALNLFDGSVHYVEIDTFCDRKGDLFDIEEVRKKIAYRFNTFPSNIVFMFEDVDNISPKIPTEDLHKVCECGIYIENTPAYYYLNNKTTA